MSSPQGSDNSARAQAGLLPELPPLALAGAAELITVEASSRWRLGSGHALCQLLGCADGLALLGAQAIEANEPHAGSRNGAP